MEIVENLDTSRERLTSPQIDRLAEILKVKAEEIKDDFKFFFPGAALILMKKENGTLTWGRKFGRALQVNNALMLYGGFKVGYLAAMLIKAKGKKWDQAMGYLAELEGRAP